MKKFLTSFMHRKIKLTTLQITLLLTMSVLIPAFLVVTAQSPQTAEERRQIVHCAHETATPFQLYKMTTWMPVKFTSVENDTAYWKFEDTHGIELGSVHFEDYTKYYDSKGKHTNRLYFEVNFDKGEWVVAYCSRCYALLSAQHSK